MEFPGGSIGRLIVLIFVCFSFWHSSSCLSPSSRMSALQGFWSSLYSFYGSQDGKFFKCQNMCSDHIVAADCRDADRAGQPLLHPSPSFLHTSSPLAEATSRKFKGLHLCCFFHFSLLPLLRARCLRTRILKSNQICGRI